MRLLFKQRFFSWFDSYDIYDEDGNTVYVVKGELSWGHRLQIYDACGNHLGTVQEKVLTWLPKFELYVESFRWGCWKRSSPFSGQNSTWTATAGRWRGTSGSGITR